MTEAEAQMNKEIGERIRRERKRRALSQDALAKLSGAHALTIGRIERGLGARPDTLRGIADALGIDVMELTDPEYFREHQGKGVAPSKSGRSEADREADLLASQFEWRRIFKTLENPEVRRLVEMDLSTAEESIVSFSDVARWLDEIEEKRQDRSA